MDFEGIANMPNQAKQSLVITTSGDRPIDEVAGDLKAAGFDVDQVLEQIGSITGSAHPDSLEHLRGVAGVSDVSPDYPNDIGPPGASIS